MTAAGHRGIIPGSFSLSSLIPRTQWIKIDSIEVLSWSDERRTKLGVFLRRVDTGDKGAKVPVTGNTPAHNNTMQGHTGQGRAMELGQCLLCQMYAALKENAFA